MKIVDRSGFAPDATIWSASARIFSGVRTVVSSERRFHRDERNERKQQHFKGGNNMCPVCIASTAVMVAGAGSTGGILAVCISRFRAFFRANRLFQRTKEK
jgi:hypothetical protein